MGGQTLTLPYSEDWSPHWSYKTPKVLYCSFPHSPDACLLCAKRGGGREAEGWVKSYL